MTKITKLNPGTKSYELALKMKQIGDDTVARIKEVEAQAKAIAAAATEQQTALNKELGEELGMDVGKIDQTYFDQYGLLFAHEAPKCSGGFADMLMDALKSSGNSN